MIKSIKSMPVNTAKLIKKIKKAYDAEDFHGVISLTTKAISDGFQISFLYITLARSLYNTGEYCDALKVLRTAGKIFNEDFMLHTTFIEVLIELNMFDEAQKMINVVKLYNDNNFIIFAEQVHLDCCIGNIGGAFDKIDNYIASHANDKEYRQNVAYRLLEVARTLCLIDPVTRRYVITEKKTFDNCLQLCEKAYNIYQHDNILSVLECVRQFGKYKFDIRNKEFMYKVVVSSAISILLFKTQVLSIGIIGSLVTLFVLYYTGKRPAWDMLKEAYLGIRPPMSEFGVAFLELSIFWDGLDNYLDSKNM